MVITADLIQLQCGSCGVIHAIPTAMYNSARDEGGFWHCPNGHSRGWREGANKTEMAKLRQERDRLAQRIAERDDTIRAERDRVAATERQLYAAKGRITKIKNRVGHGVCPCCNRTFSDLQRHMNSKHADYAKSPDSDTATVN